MTAAATNGQLVDQVREALDAARQAGRPAPGRPTLVRLTGATDHAVRKALAELATENTSAGDKTSPASEPSSSASAAGGGRLVAWAGFVFGSVMSVAANVLHTWLPTADNPPGWSPAVAAQIGAAVWPIGLLLAWRYDPLAAAVGPLVLDGLMVISGFALLAMTYTSADETTSSLDDQIQTSRDQLGPRGDRRRAEHL